MKLKYFKNFIKYWSHIKDLKYFIKKINFYKKIAFLIHSKEENITYSVSLITITVFIEDIFGFIYGRIKRECEELRDALNNTQKSHISDITVIK